MSGLIGPNIIRDNIILNLDAANYKSSKGRRSILQWDTWLVIRMLFGKVYIMM